MKISILGCGKLGKAFVRAFLRTGVCSSEDLLLIEREEWQVAQLRASFHARCLPKADDCVSQSDVVMLAVKPQDYEQAAAELAAFVRPEQLLLSVMTGITIERMSRSFHGHTQLVRCMPNLPAQIGKSITPFVCHKSLDAHHRQRAMQILASIGEHLELQGEDLLNAVTALSATGPGYIYEIISHMIQAAKQMGFSHEQACTLIGHTFDGSVALWLQSGLSAEELRDTVKSKGGTTEAALKRFAEGDFGRTLREGILAAFARAKELGGG